MLFIVPSEHRTTSLFPKDISGIEDHDLESMTGADFVISLWPTLPSMDLQSHIEEGSLFVQVKFGGDITSFDQIKRSIARMQDQKIPREQALLLAVVQDDEATDGSLGINGGIFAQDIKYKTWQKVKAKWRARGGSYDQIPHRDCLASWILAQEEAMKDLKEEGSRRFIYSEPSQVVDEIKRQNNNPVDNLRYVLRRGICGPILVENIIDILRANQLPVNLFHSLDILTSLNAKLKPEYKVPGWGKKSLWDLRRVLGLPQEFNLGWLFGDEKGDMVTGANIALEMLGENLRNRVKGKEAFAITRRQINEFWIK